MTGSRANVFDPRFIRTAVHALRTPLQTIHGFAHLLTQDMPRASFDQALGLIRDDSGRLMAMLDDLGWRGRLAGGDLALDLEPCDLGTLLSRLALNFEHEQSRHFVDLRAMRLPAVQADAERVNDILLALLRHAASVSPAGRLKVGARGGRRVVEVSVTDSGSRIPARLRAAVFQADQPVPRSWGWPEAGLGMNLYVARELALAMGGELKVEPAGAPRGRRGNVWALSLPRTEARDA
jgi:signal transduction histidine kinase